MKRPFRATWRQAQILDAYIAHGSRKEAAAALGISVKSIDGVLSELRKNAKAAGLNPRGPRLFVLWVS